MGAMPNEPSMEEILSSIKRIIADEDRALPRAPRRNGHAASRILAEDADDQILELTEALLDDSDSLEEEDVPETPAARTGAKTAKASNRPEAKAPRARPNGAADAAVLSDMSAKAARESLANLSKMLVRSDDPQPNTLEGMVREMLRPMLKEWLDANLPDLVETMVKREIDRITGGV